MERRVAEFYPTVIILKPLVPTSYINRAYIFNSKEQVLEYFERAKNKIESFDTLYRSVKSIWKKYIDADDFHISICAADTIFTYFQDKIGLTHYLFFVGNTNCGKSNNLSVFNLLAYRNMTSTDITHANIYQFLGSDQEGVGTICEDEADGIDEDRVKMGTYKNGYTTGRPVFRMLEASSGSGSGKKTKQTRLNTFCFKAFAAERLPDSLKAKGFNERVLQIFCTYGFPEYDITEVVNPAGEEKFQKLLDELNETRNRLLMYRLLHYHDAFPDINVNLENREKQLFKPLLRIFQKTKTLDELLPVITEFVKSKRRANANTLHAFLYEMIKDLIKRRGNSYVLDSKTIWEFITDPDVLPGEPIPNKSMSYYSTEFGAISQKEIIGIYESVFGAKKPKRHGSSSKLIFDENKLKRLGRIYELSLDIKVTESNSNSNSNSNANTKAQQQNENGYDGYDGYDVQEEPPINEDSMKEETSNNYNNPSDNDKEIDDNDTQTIDDDSKNSALTSHNPTHPTHPTQINESSTKKWVGSDDKNDDHTHPTHFEKPEGAKYICKNCNEEQFTDCWELHKESCSGNGRDQ